MKKTGITILLVLAGTLLSSAQKKYVGLELAGTSGLSGISFDSRFSETSKLGYKVGISYGFEKNEGVSHWYFSPVKAYYPQNGQRCNYFSIPMNVHYLLGKQKNFLETALGLSLFATDYDFKKDERIGYFPYARFAYRHESAAKPLLFSIGIDIPFRTPGSGLGYSVGFMPAISLGYKL